MLRILNRLKASKNIFLQKTMLTHLPLYMMLEPTNHCNLSCPLCPTGNKTLRVPQGYMNFKCYEQLIDELAPTLKTLLLWGFGEPLLNPDIFKMVNKANKCGIITKISTNGQCFGDNSRCFELVESGLDQLRISLDGVSNETLRIYRRGAHLEEILDGILNIINAKTRTRSKTPLILLQFILMKHNQHEVHKFKELANTLGLPWRIKTVSVGNCEDGTLSTEYLPEFGPVRYNIETLRDGTKNIRPKSARPKICPYPWLWAHVNWDGTVVPCCKDPHRSHIMGNAFRDGGFLKLWNNPKYILFRSMYLQNPASLKRCKKCDHPFKC